MYEASYGFTMAKDWQGINELPFCSIVNLEITVMHYLTLTNYLLAISTTLSKLHIFWYRPSGLCCFICDLVVFKLKNFK